MWFKRKVQKGTGTGKKIGFPTLNFNVGPFHQFHGEGVYGCEVKISKLTYQGALFFGKSLGKTKRVLELYVINFHKNMYGQFVQFRVLKKIRRPKTFTNLENLKKQITEDMKNM